MWLPHLQESRAQLPAVVFAFVLQSKLAQERLCPAK